MQPCSTAVPKPISSVKPLLKSFRGVCSAFCVTPSRLHTGSTFLFSVFVRGAPTPGCSSGRRKQGATFAVQPWLVQPWKQFSNLPLSPNPCARLHRRHFSLDRSDSALIGFHASSPSPFQSIFHAAVRLSKTHSDLVPPLLANPSPVAQSPSSLVWRWPEPSPASSLDSWPSSHFSLLSCVLSVRCAAARASVSPASCCSLCMKRFPRPSSPLQRAHTHTHSPCWLGELLFSLQNPRLLSLHFSSQCPAQGPANHGPQATSGHRLDSCK